ncbi:uncharacterized protein LOC128752024 [Synchiropus splendidus]|uniref:uncharacterized protein LOC128752024 n=1 Tax=Synchiropus splendidus TaxID=270530 RepID=UPI00237E725B|nr:uncharacterized protein LOC128752024 [Synchiropus splendidus]
MDDKLILAVFNCPELYNVTLSNYRCTESRANAWRNISVLLGIPSEECKRKWKNMRDRYLKEVRMEIKCKKQGEIVQSRWKYRQLMNFIAPFTGSRSGVADVCGNNEEDQDHPDMESGSAEGETPLTEVTKMPLSSMKVQSDLKPQVPFVSQLPPADPQLATRLKASPVSQVSPVSKMGRKRRLMDESIPLPTSTSTPSATKWLVKDNASALPNRQRDEDELFLLSFVPALKRLAPQKRCETKMKIQQIMYEAEFNIAQDSHEKHSDTETQD